MKGRKIITLLMVFFFIFPVFMHAQEACTIGVAVGKATIDGRPLLWKNRDSRDKNNSVHLFKRADLSFVGIIKSGDTTKVWMGVNTLGFAILNSSSKDLEGDNSSENGIIMKKALETCQTVGDFEELLLKTNKKGRKTRANFGTIDILGQGAIFETGNHSFVRFNAKDAPYGSVIRTNYALTGVKDSLAYGYQRRARADLLILRKAREKTLSYPYIFQTVSRDLVNESAYPYPLPFSGRQDSLPRGVLYTQNSINRYKTVLVAVFHGVSSGENPLLTTMWVILGQPVCGVAFPVWANVMRLPAEISVGDPPKMNALVQQIESIVYPDTNHAGWLYTSRLQSSAGAGLLPQLIAAEDSIFTNTKRAVTRWRKVPNSEEMNEFEGQTARRVLNLYQRIVKKNRLLKGEIKYRKEVTSPHLKKSKTCD